MYVFIDTEFTSLSDPRLISIGAVSECGLTFYGIVEGVPLSACTPFVKAQVLPALQVHPADAHGTNGEVARAFLAWLEGLAGSVLVVDDECDQELVIGLLGLYGGRGNPGPEIRLLPVTANPQAITAMSDWFANESCRVRHNALDDAFGYRHVVGLLSLVPLACS